MNAQIDTNRHLDVRNRVLQSLNKLEETGEGWSYVTDVLIHYVIQLQKRYGLKHDSGTQAKDIVQESILDFLDLTRKWRNTEHVNFDCPLSIRKTFVGFMCCVAKSIFFNFNRKEQRIVNESSMTTNDDVSPLELLAPSVQLSAINELSEEAYLSRFEGDERSHAIVKTVLEKDLYTNSSLAVELETTSQDIVNGKKRIRNVIDPGEFLNIN